MCASRSRAANAGRVSDHGARFFGRDYGLDLMRWIDARYTRVATYGPSIDEPEKIGGITLFQSKTPQFRFPTRANYSE